MIDKKLIPKYLTPVERKMYREAKTMEHQCLRVSMRISLIEEQIEEIWKKCSSWQFELMMIANNRMEKKQ